MAFICNTRGSDRLDGHGSVGHGGGAVALGVLEVHLDLVVGTHLNVLEANLIRDGEGLRRLGLRALVLYDITQRAVWGARTTCTTVAWNLTSRPLMSSPTISVLYLDAPCGLKRKYVLVCPAFMVTLPSPSVAGTSNLMNSPVSCPREYTQRIRNSARCRHSRPPWAWS